jgi:hypothetical protein
MADPRVVIVTGSRTRRWQRQLYGVLDQIAAEVGRNQIVIRHGNNPAGADWWAHMWCDARRLGQYGRAAGMIRNRNMCRKGAYLCVAFLDWCRAPGCNAVPTAATA